MHNLNDSLPTEAEVRIRWSQYNFKNFNSSRLIKVKASFEEDQGKCKWDLDDQVQRKVPIPSWKV